MHNSIYIGLIQNIALLLSFSLIYDYFWAKNEDLRKTTGKVIAGLFIGIITILLMTFTWQYTPGVVFDTRSVILSISGLFFGVVPTLIAMISAAIYRILLGGDGMWMGIAVILSSGFIGMFWRLFFPPRKIKMPQYNILLLGLVVHLVMLACTLFLPKDGRLQTFIAILPTVLVLYVPTTMLLGMLMLKRWQIWQQQKLVEKEEIRYRQLFESAGEAILVAQEGYIHFANQRLVDLLGRDYDEILSLPFTEFIHPDDRDFVLQRHQERVQNIETPRYYSFRVVTGKGDIKWVEINSVRFDWNNEPSSLSFLSDVTSFRETSRQLVLAKNKAEESDRLKTIFLANMSHEIRTPMNAILGFTDLLKSRSLSENKKTHYINMIQTAGGQLLHVINDIVDISKLEVNQLSMTKKHCRLYDIFEQSVEVFRNNTNFMEKKDVSLSLSFPDDCKDILVNTDPFRIRQVIDNLLGNAIKYTDKGNIELKCMPVINESGLHIDVHIKDTGSGIPESKKDIIFEQFRQVEENQYREGAGLGLSISKGIIELMGGTIGFNSEEGKGSDFYFTLDLEIVEKPVRSLKKTENNVPELKGMTILVAEDDMTSYYLIHEYLKETNVHVEHARDGEILLKQLEKSVPEIILLDINMPKKDGYECLAEIRRRGLDCKIIAQTAYAMENEKERCLNSGCHGYVAKPIEPETLYKEIMNVLKT